MKQKFSLYLIIGTALAFMIYELIGHLFLMAVPMNVRHGLSILIGTTLAVLIASVSIHAIWQQQKELKQLAHLRDYLLLMQSHYMRLSPSALKDPNQQLEYQALELQYAEIQPRLASDNPTARAKALVDLTGLARTHLPYMDSPYPFYIHAASHLAMALYLEPEPSVREEVLYSLQALSTLARDNNSHLLGILIDNLTHANHMAFRMFLDALTNHLSRTDQVQDSDLKSFLPVARFTTSDETDMVVLRELALSPVSQEAIAAQRVLLKTDKSPHPTDFHALEKARFAASALRDTRDALAQTLRALSKPEDFPPETSEHRFWKRAQPLELQDCFLVGADLKSSHLHGADFRRAYLMGVNLTDTRMPNADLSDSNLWKAHLVGAKLESAKLWDANLQDATFTTSHLQGADLSRARLQGAYMIGTDLKDACLWKIKIADDEHKKEHCANFTNSNWWEARFTDMVSGSTDQETQTWLKFTYPQPLSEAEAIAKAKIPSDPFAHV